MEEQASDLYPAPRPQNLNCGGSFLNCNSVPCHSNMVKIGFQGPFSIGAILSSSSNTAILQLDKEQHQIGANRGKMSSLTSDWVLSQSPSPPRYYGLKTTKRWHHHHQQRQGNREGREASVDKCEPTNRMVSLKRSRTIFSPTQLQSLEQEFRKNQYIAGKHRGRLAATLHLTDAQVKVWFQNRRIRYRKQNHKSCQTVHLSN